VRSLSEGWSFAAAPDRGALLGGGSTLFHVKLDPEGVLAGLGADQVGKLRSFAATLSSQGADLGLVSRTDRDRVWARHILDSLRVLSCFLPQDRTLADLGSGGGLPGIPLAVARPSIPVTLIESRSQRVGFLERVVQDLAIGNARVLHARAEEVSERFGACTARAVSGPVGTWRLAAPLLEDGGRVFYFAGRSFGHEELEDLLAAGARANICGSPLFPGSGSLVIMQSGT
jgi:16S rRNA (guanine527-N7)-methyltransferase